MLGGAALGSAAVWVFEVVLPDIFDGWALAGVGVLAAVLGAAGGALYHQKNHT